MSGDGVSTDVRIRKTQASTMSRKFVSVMTRFSEILAASKSKQREQLKRQYKIVYKDKNEKEINDMVEEGADGGTQVFGGKRLAEAESALNDIQERHKDLMNLEKSLVELRFSLIPISGKHVFLGALTVHLSEMFMDLSIMIESQGEQIDRIEFSVEEAGEYVERGKEILDDAKKIKREIRKKKVYIAICCAILCVIILSAIIGPLLALRVT